MKVLSSTEVQELVEHFVERPDIWISHNDVWVRRCGKLDTQEYALALKVRNGLPDGLYALTTKPLSWSATSTHEYIEWLLSKYTSYEHRRYVLEILSRYKTKGNLEAISRDIYDHTQSHR